MIKIMSTEMVLPSEGTPRGPMWLSNLDLAARRGHTTTVFFYRPTTSDSTGTGATGSDFVISAAVDIVGTLKSSLAKALVPFYPLAGRLGVDQADGGRVRIDCTAEGARFVVAHSDTALDDLDGFAPSTEMRNLLVPPAEQPDPPCILLLAQVTLFKCGGVALGTAMHHTVMDACSAFHFIETWSGIARGKTSFPAPPPFHDRRLLSARRNRRVVFDHAEYKSNPNSDVVPSDISTTYASSILEMSKKHIDALKLRCSGGAGGGGARVSTFRAITALIWRCVCVARKLDASSKSQLYTMIDMRSRMCPPLPPTYLGNAVIRTSVAATVRDVISSPMSRVARMLHGATNQGDEYARSLIDYLDTTDMTRLPRGGLPITDLRVISWLGMPTRRADFGWGELLWVGPASMYYSGYVCLMSNPKNDDGAGVSVVLSLEAENLPGFKQQFFEELANLDV